MVNERRSRSQAVRQKLVPILLSGVSQKDIDLYYHLRDRGVRLKRDPKTEEESIYRRVYYRLLLGKRRSKDVKYSAEEEHSIEQYFSVL